jgi:hypothetical protein
MRRKKIRGHKRRYKQIENWRLNNLSFDLKDDLVSQNDKMYVKIRVSPWNDISLTNSIVPEPARNTKLKILNGLLDIYEDWKKQLDRLGKPYYLKIWLFEPRFSMSQVVCAIDENIAFYENTFFKPEINKSINLDTYGKLKTRLQNLNWEFYLDEDHYYNDEVGDPEYYASKKDYEETKVWFFKLLKKPHRKYKLEEPIGDTTEQYSFKRGVVWLGGQK